MSFFKLVHSVKKLDAERINKDINTEGKNGLGGVVPSDMKFWVGFSTAFRNNQGLDLKGQVTDQHRWVIGVSKDTDLNDKFKVYSSKIDELVSRVKDEDWNTVSLNNGMSNQVGVKSYGGYLQKLQPNHLYTVKCTNKKGGNETRMYSIAEYDNHTIFFSQFTKSSGSGVYAVVASNSMSEDELIQFGVKLSEKLESDHDFMEGAVPEGDFMIDWNDKDRVAGLEKEEEDKLKKENDLRIKEELKKKKLEEKAKADLEKAAKANRMKEASDTVLE